MLVCMLVCPYGTVCVGVCAVAPDKADKLLYCVLKHSAMALLRPLHHLFLSSLFQNYIPEEWYVLIYRDKANASNDTRRQLFFFPREKEELPRAGLKPAMFCVLGRCCTS